MALCRIIRFILVAVCPNLAHLPFDVLLDIRLNAQYLVLRPGVSRGQFRGPHHAVRLTIFTQFGFPLTSCLASST